MPDPIVCPRCLKSDYHVLPFKEMPDTLYVCYGCGLVWKVRKDGPPSPPRDS